jgi:HK97 family phage prohead protease
MNINIRADDTVEIDGYVNAVERNSKPLWSRIGQFIERVCKGAFTKALRRNEDVLLLLNHNPDRILARTSDDSLELREDNIGLHARAVVSDPEVVEKARSGDLVGWSFGFYDTPDGVEKGIEQESGLPLRKIRDLDLTEVSILDKRKTPAYDGTLVEVRDDEKTEFRSEAFIDDININVEEINETVEERNEPEQEHAPEAIDVIDYSKWDAMIAEMKGERE